METINNNKKDRRTFLKMIPLGIAAVFSLASFDLFSSEKAADDRSRPLSKSGIRDGIQQAHTTNPGSIKPEPPPVKNSSSNLKKS